MSGHEIKFIISCDIDHPVRFKVECLEWQMPSSSTAGTGASTSSSSTSPRARFSSMGLQGVLSASAELYVECTLYIDGQPFGPPEQTRHVLMRKRSCRWSEWVTLHAKYRDLTANAQLGFTVYDVTPPLRKKPVGGATIRLFSKQGQLKTGLQKLHLWPGQQADGRMPTSTPGKVPKYERGEVERLEALVNKYDQNELPRLDWLDRTTFLAIERHKNDPSGQGGLSDLNLVVELQPFDHPVQFQEVPGAQLLQPPAEGNELVRVFDPEVNRQNPSENKELKLARSDRGLIDRGLKPNLEEKKRIEWILNQPSTRVLNGDERQLLWKFRFSLIGNKRALTKFLRCVDWSDTQEANQATDLMRKWAPIDIADALELLSSAFANKDVRAFAVQVLDRADDEELKCYLLQLVQALRYEPGGDIKQSPLVAFLIQRALDNNELANFLYWYLVVEIADPDVRDARLFETAHNIFLEKFRQLEDGKLWEQVARSVELTMELRSIMNTIQRHRGNVQRKQEKMRQLLLRSSLLGNPGNPTSFTQAYPLPLDPRILITGIVPQESIVFKSALNPFRLTLATSDGAKVRVIFKKGDDLRQDQLVVQMVALMDRLLKKENLDLKLTPYHVLATSRDAGLVEFIPSVPLAHVLAEHRTIIKYLQQYHADESGPFGITAECLDTFVKSCAGYCVIMYILGVGDRHLDNLLLQEDGRLFHIDFGYILNHDPKPFPPPMKLCREMVEAMGGADSEHYRKFQTYCCEAYNILRKSSNLIINLFQLMAGAKIPDIADTSILKLKDKFLLEKDNDAAVQFFLQLINESVSALFPQMVEVVHRWAQYWR